MLTRPFSLGLALRYLNPVRNLLSIITGIGLLGVALGVLVLIVVLSVMYGFEREVKDRILSFTPHIVINHAPGGTYLTIPNWQEIATELEGIPGVEDAYPYIQDNVILDVNGYQLPVLYRAIDTTDEAQVAKLETIVASNLYGGSADMGLDEKAVVSEKVAIEFQLAVGDKIQLYSTRTFKDVFRAYKATERPAAHEEYSEHLAQIKDDLRKKVKKSGNRERFLFDELNLLIEQLRYIHDQEIRDAERVLIADAINLLAAAEKLSGNEDVRTLKAGTVDQAVANIAALSAVDIRAEDDLALRNLKEIVLPKELEVVGIFRTNQNTVPPAIFVPLNTGMELSGNIDGISGLALRTSNPYKVHLQQARVQRELPEGWITSTWADQYDWFFKMVKKEKAMMSFVLSFIAIGSAFSIMAVMVMFAMQKKREIGVLQALGARSSQICWVFVFQGMITGLIGALLGLGLAKLVIDNRNAIQEFLRQFGLDPFPPEFHGIDTIPAYLTPGVAIIAPLGAFILCSIAPLLPAFIASTRDPARCLRDI